MTEPTPPFLRPSAGERFFNRLFGVMVRLGLGLRHNYLLEVRGRKSGTLYATPVDLLIENGQRFLVAPRGYTIPNGSATPMPAGRSACEKAGGWNISACGRSPMRKNRPFLKPTSIAFGPRCSGTFPSRRGLLRTRSFLWLRVIRRSNCCRRTDRPDPIPSLFLMAALHTRGAPAFP